MSVPFNAITPDDLAFLALLHLIDVATLGIPLTLEDEELAVAYRQRADMLLTLMVD